MCSEVELDGWLKALSKVIYGPRGGGMFGNDLRTQIRREVQSTSLIMLHAHNIVASRH